MERIMAFLQSISKQYDVEMNKVRDDLKKNNSNVENKISKIKPLQSNEMNINNYTDKELLSMVNELPLDDDLIDESTIEKMMSDLDYNIDTKRKKMIFNLLQIKYLCDYEEELREEHLELISDFTKDMLKIYEQLKKEGINNSKRLKELNEIIENINKFKSFLNFETNTIANNYPFLKKIIDESNESDYSKRQVIASLLDRNLDIYKKNMSNSLTENMKNDTIIKEKLSKEEVKELFKLYGYELEDLYSNKKGAEDKYVELLLSNGNLDNIKDIFEAFVKYGISKDYFDLKSDRVKHIFITLLCRSNSNIISNVLDLAKENNIKIDIILKDPLLLVESIRDISNQYEDYDKSNEGEEIFLSGFSNHFIKNVKFLKTNGFNIEVVANKAISVLSCAPNTIKYTYEMMKLYGIEVPPVKSKEKLFSYKSLSSSRSEEIIDRYIELCDNGYDYITKSLSRLLNKNINNIMFYYIYSLSKSRSEVNISQFTKLLEDKKESTQEELDRIVKVVKYPIKNREEYDNYVEYKLAERKSKVLSGKLDLSKGNALYDYDIYSSKILSDIDSKYVSPINPYVFKFGDVTISKNKFLKVFNVLKDKIDNNIKDIIMYSLTYKSIIDKESLEKINKEVDKIINARRLG